MKIIRLLILIPFLIASNAYANVSLSLTDISFSNPEPIEGEKIRVFARVYNYGENDVFGLVDFENIGEPQIISIRPNTYDDVFLDWIPDSGDYNIKVKLIVNEDVVHDNEVIKYIFVDSDMDNDGIGDTKDNDNDNDGISDEEESFLGTSTTSSDTDNDGINDKEDLFPLDPKESSDNDLDGIGDNQDLDDDNDNLSDEDEIILYDTNPLSPDTDMDLVMDDIEVEQGTDPKNQDTDKDGVIDSKDKFPLDPNKSRASIFDIAGEYLKNIGFPSLKILGLVFIALFVLLMILFKRR